MANFIPAPGVAQLVVTGHINTHKWNMVLHYQQTGSTSPWTAGQLATLCTTWMSSANTRYKTLFGSNTTFDSVQAVDLTNETPAGGADTTHGFTCTGGGQLAPSLSAMVNMRIAVRYRGGHPRMYFPPLNSVSQSTSEDTWTTSGQSGLTTAVTNHNGDINAAITGCNQAIPLWLYAYQADPAHNKYLREKVGFKSSWPVISWQTSPVIRSQRRRITAAA